MRDCSEYAELASVYVDGELTSSEAEPLLEHLESCTHCQMVLASFSRIREETRLAIAGVRCPDRLRATISDSLDHEREAQAVQRPRRRQWWQMSWAPAAAAAVFLFLFLLRPAYVPLQTLPDSVRDGGPVQVQRMTPPQLVNASREHGLKVRPVDLNAMGMSMKDSGITSVGGCKAAYFTWADTRGSHVTVFQICPDERKVPAGADLSRYDCTGRLVKTSSGENIVFWNRDGQLVAICSEMPVRRLVEVGRAVSGQLHLD